MFRRRSQRPTGAIRPADDPVTVPIPLTDRIVIALDEMRAARDAGDLAREFSWSQMVDRLLDRYAKGDR